MQKYMSDYYSRILIYWEIVHGPDPQNFAYWYHLGWQGLVVIFNYLCMSSIYFNMIVLAQW